MDDVEANYIIDAIDFIGKRGYLFLPLYNFDVKSGIRSHKADKGIIGIFSLRAALDDCKDESLPLS